MDEITDSSQAAQGESDVDALLESIENPKSNVQEVPAPKAEEYSFTHNGKEIKADIEKLKRWASQGYDAPNRLGELNKVVNEYKTREQQLKELETRYKTVDEYVRKNPEFYSKFMQAYQQEVSGNPLAALDPIKQEVEQLKNSFKTIEQERQEQRIKQEDELYQKEVTELKKTYPKVDFDSKGQDGKSLEYKVLQYALDNGIKKFTTAFRDFYHDELMKINAESAKEKVVSEKQTRFKLGILDDGQLPKSKSSEYSRGKSWGDLEKDALRELGIT